MASADQIKALLRNHIDGDESGFLSIAMQVAAHEARKGHNKVARELRSMIDEAKSRRGTGRISSKTIPISKPTGELSELLDVFYPSARLDDMVLDTDLSNRINRIVREQKNVDRIKTHGLVLRQRLLLIGPPGCGKTMSASALAGELGLPLFAVRLDGLITKYMGESIAKLRLIFDAIRETRAVYLFDEFDSIGSNRSYTNDVGEIRRILNFFLMLIERDESNSIIVAATNHPQSLDRALFRRFDDILEFRSPNKDLLLSLFSKYLSDHSTFSTKHYAKLADLASGLSFDEVARACNDAVKDMLINEEKTLDFDGISNLIAERVTFRRDYLESHK